MDIVAIIGPAHVVRLRWRPCDAISDTERYQVLSVRQDKIRQIVEFRTIHGATKLAERFAAQPDSPNKP